MFWIPKSILSDRWAVSRVYIAVYVCVCASSVPLCTVSLSTTTIIICAVRMQRRSTHLDGQRLERGARRCSFKSCLFKTFDQRRWNMRSRTDLHRVERAASESGLVDSWYMPACVSRRAFVDTFGYDMDAEPMFPETSFGGQAAARQEQEVWATASHNVYCDHP